VDAIRVLLVNGELAVGAGLPSVRRLAMELGVHFNTVGEAYRELADEGWLDLRHGRGATVAARERPDAISAGRLEEFRVQIRNLVAQMRSEGLPARRIVAELRSAMGRLKS
jgi:DNA-binding transcriptional regulator YhcF (GntR family)